MKNFWSVLSQKTYCTIIVFCSLFIAANAKDPFHDFRTSFPKDFPTLRRTVIFNDKFVKEKMRWGIDPTFPGELQCNNALILTPKKRNKSEYGVALKLYRLLQPMSGKKYEFSALISGFGNAKTGVIIYGNDRNGKPVQKTFWGEEKKLDAFPQKFIFDADCSRQKVNFIGLLLYIDTGGKMICHEAAFSEISDASIHIGSPELLLVKKGDHSPRFHFNVRNIGNAKHDMILLTSDENNVNSLSVLADDNNGRAYPDQMIINRKTSCTLSINGTTSTVYILPVESPFYEQCDEAAKRIHLKTPLQIVIFGDSLQDKNFTLNYGHGACEQLSFWLNRYNPGFAVIKNLAVKGDTVQRALQRLRKETGQSTKRVFEQRVYDNMFKTEADVVFIQFGHNDTAFKTSNSECDDSNNINFGDIASQLEDMIKICNKYWPKAKIVVFSSASSCEDICRQRHRDLAKSNPNRIAGIYGVPECLEKYNTIAQSVAKKNGAMFYDIYSGMKALPHDVKAKLFIPADGVHLSIDGHVYMAQKYLELIGNIIGL